MEAWSLTHWTTREVPNSIYEKFNISCKYDFACFFQQITFWKLWSWHQFWRNLWKWVALGCTRVHCVAVVIIIAQTSSLISMGTCRMRESKQANNSYSRDELTDAFPPAESSEGWCSICWFCHVTCENKRDTKKTNDIVILSGLTVTAHRTLVVMCCFVYLSLFKPLQHFRHFPESISHPHPPPPPYQVSPLPKV